MVLRPARAGFCLDRCRGPSWALDQRDMHFFGSAGLSMALAALRPLFVVAEAQPVALESLEVAPVLSPTLAGLALRGRF